MRKIIAFIFLVTPYLFTMAQFEGILILKEDAEQVVTLTSAGTGSYYGYYNKEGEAALRFSYSVRWQSKKDKVSSVNTYEIQLIPEPDGRYKIMSKLLSGSFYDEKGNPSGHKTINPFGKGSFDGYTDDAELNSVKIWEYYKKERAKIIYYTRNEVDTPAVFEIEDKEYTDLESYLKSRIKNLIPGVTGSLTLTYTVSEYYGHILDIEVKNINLHNTDKVDDICTQLSDNLYSTRWEPAQRKGKSVTTKEEITLSF